MSKFIESNEFTMAKLPEHQNKDFFKLYYATVTESKEDVHFEDEEFTTLLKIARKELPAKEYFSDDYTLYATEDDGLMSYYVEYKRDNLVYFDGCLIDEEEQEYMDRIFPDEKILMTAIDISQRGKVILSPDIKIGDKLDLETVTKYFDSFIDSEIRVFELLYDQTVIKVQTCDYTLELWCHEGNLFSAVIKRLGLQN